MNIEATQSNVEELVELAYANPAWAWWRENPASPAHEYYDKKGVALAQREASEVPGSEIHIFYRCPLCGEAISMMEVTKHAREELYSSLTIFERARQKRSGL